MDKDRGFSFLIYLLHANHCHDFCPDFFSKFTACELYSRINYLGLVFGHFSTYYFLQLLSQIQFVVAIYFQEARKTS